MLKTELKHRETIQISTFTIRGGVDNVICDLDDDLTGTMRICATLTEAYACIAAELDNRLVSAESYIDILKRDAVLQTRKYAAALSHATA